MTVPEVLWAPQWNWLRTTVRSRLEEDNGAATVWIDLNALPDREQRTLRWLLTWPATHQGKRKVDLRRLDRELTTRITDGVSLQDTLAALGGELDDVRERRRKARRDKVASDARTWTELLQLTADVPELANERTGLQRTPPSPALHVPSGSRTGTTRWCVFEAALRAAAAYYLARRDDERFSPKGLAGQAWRDTKKTWTMHRRFAFQELVGLPFHEALDVPDTELRMRGPLVWVCKDVVANARICEPWLSVPARGLRVLGTTDFAAKGILLVENSDTFEQVCRKPEIVERWLCVWGKGFVSTGLIDFLHDRPVPIAAWGDLDAHGIKIIHDVARRTGVPVHPVGMSVQLWDAGVRRKQSEENLASARTLAAELVNSGPPALRPLAAAIAETGDGCEQEPLARKVLPTLLDDLKRIEEHASATATCGRPRGLTHADEAQLPNGP